MKVLLAVVALTSVVYAQNPEIEKRYDQAVAEAEALSESKNGAALSEIITNKYLTWKIEENNRAYMLTLDFPYPSVVDPKDFLSMTIVKIKGQSRPRVFSIAVGTNVDASKGIAIHFAKHPDAVSHRMILDKDAIARKVLDSSQKDYSKAVFPDMKTDEIDILEKMKTEDFMFFDFYGQNGREYFVAYPLFKFKEQYKNIN